VTLDVEREGQREQGKGKENKGGRHLFSPFTRISPPIMNITATINPVTNVRGLSGKLVKAYTPTLNLDISRKYLPE